jgi:hypothetical protein
MTSIDTVHPALPGGFANDDLSRTAGGAVGTGMHQSIPWHSIITAREDRRAFLRQRVQSAPRPARFATARRYGA